MTKGKMTLVLLGGIAFLALVGTGVWYLQVSKPADESTNTVVQNDDTITISAYAATLSYNQGDVWVALDGTPFAKAETDTVLHEGDGIKTGENSKAIIELENGDVIRLGASSELTLVYSNEVAVSILQSAGTTYNRVAKDQSRVYQVVSSIATVQAVGTAFDVTLGDEVIDVAVVESSVKVLSAGEQEVLAQGKMGKYTKGKTAGEISDLNDETLSNEWYAWNKEEDQKKNVPLGAFVEDTTETETQTETQLEAKVSLSISQTDTGFKLTWETENVTATNGFKILRGESENPEFGKAEVAYVESSDARSYQWEVKDGKQYHFRVCLYDGSACTLYSNDVKETAPKEEVKEEEKDEEKPEETPALTGPNLSVKAEESGVGLWWNDKTDLPGFTYYKIVRSETNADLKYPGDGHIGVSEEQGSYRDYTAIAGKTYYYRICAVGDEVWCGQVKQVKAITKNDPPSAVTASGVYSAGKITLSWNKSTEKDFQYYKIVWSETDSTPTYPADGYLKWVEQTTLSFADEGDAMANRGDDVDLSTGTHYYSICVVDTAGQVACSNTVTLKDGVIQ